MPGKSKIWDASQDNAGELRRQMYREFKRNDGVIDEGERRLLAQADRVCAFASGTATFVRVGLRWFGGGEIDRGLVRQLKDADALLDHEKAAQLWGSEAA